MTSDCDKESVSVLNRKIRRRNYGVLLIVIGLLGIAVSTIYPGNTEIAYYCSQAIFVLGVVVLLSVGQPRCPHCGKHFFMRWLGRLPLGPANILSGKCMNCGRDASDPAM